MAALSKPFRKLSEVHRTPHSSFWRPCTTAWARGEAPPPRAPTHCPQDRPRRLPCWLRSAVLGRSDARSSKGLEYHLPWTRERAVWQCHRPARAATRLTPCSLAEPLIPSPGHALQPQQPPSHPSASPCARRPPAPPAVLMRAGLCASQGRVRRPLGV